MCIITYVYLFALLSLLTVDAHEHRHWSYPIASILALPMQWIISLRDNYKNNHSLSESK